MVPVNPDLIDRVGVELYPINLGSIPPGTAAGALERLANRAHHRQTGDRDCLAPQGSPVVLDMENSDPQYEPRQVRCGALRAFTANCSSPASISGRPAWANTWLAPGNLHRRPGAWSRGTSLLCRRSVFSCFTCFWFLLTRRRPMVHFSVTTHPAGGRSPSRLRTARRLRSPF
jgi:hypothetical protein